MTKPLNPSNPVERPRRYQLLAAEAATSALVERDSTTIAMPWGTGKTWTGALAAELLAPAGEPIAHFVPNAYHVDMVRREWETRTDRFAIAACAPPAAEDEDRGQHQGYFRIRDHAVASPAELAEALATAPGAVVVCPYDSLALVCEAQRTRQIPRFAVALLDEVHRTTSPTVARDERIDWTGVHDRARLGARKRIGLSARPGAHAPTGPVAYRLTYEAAIRARVLSPYRVVVAVAPTRTRAEALIETIQSDPTASEALVLTPTDPSDNVLPLIGHLRRRPDGTTPRHVLAALASPRPPREALAHALRTELWLGAGLEALASADDRFAQALRRAHEAQPSGTALLTVLGTEARDRCAPP